MLQQVLEAFWSVTVELAPALFLGLLVAGLVKEFLPLALVQRHLGGQGLSSVVKSVLVGVPMPLCSCGVVPAAISLKKQGGSSAAAAGFLISTPQTGVDSVMVTAAFLGWPFALFKLAAAAVTGISGGWLVGLWDRSVSETEGTTIDPRPSSSIPRASKDRSITPALSPGIPLPSRLLSALRYSVFDLWAGIEIYLAVGVVLAAVISALVPPGALAGHAWSSGITGMLFALVVSMPLYVCTTSSVPIAAALIAAGMPTGTALVFLMAGPATNIATIGAVHQGLGRRVLVVYLVVVAVASMAFGLLFDWLLPGAGGTGALCHNHGASWFAHLSGVVFWLGIAFLLGRRLFRRKPEAACWSPLQTANRHQSSSSCPHCRD